MNNTTLLVEFIVESKLVATYITTVVELESIGCMVNDDAFKEVYGLFRLTWDYCIIDDVMRTLPKIVKLL